MIAYTQPNFVCGQLQQNLTLTFLAIIRIEHFAYMNVEIV